MFNESYWIENYSDPQSMDGVGNAKDHILYLKSFMSIELVDISTIADYGFGLGFLLETAVDEFKPYKVLGIEPSSFIFEQFDRDRLKKISSTKIKLENIDIKNYLEKSKRGWNRFDLGLCTSVFQYISDEDLKKIVPLLASQVKYLYFSVPTDIELERQCEEVEFHDRYALRRSRDFYYDILAPHFTFISARILESRVYFDRNTTSFTDLLFRF